MAQRQTINQDGVMRLDCKPGWSLAFFLKLQVLDEMKRTILALRQWFNVDVIPSMVVCKKSFNTHSSIWLTFTRINFLKAHMGNLPRWLTRFHFHFQVPPWREEPTDAFYMAPTRTSNPFSLWFVYGRGKITEKKTCEDGVLEKFKLGIMCIWRNQSKFPISVAWNFQVERTHGFRNYDWYLRAKVAWILCLSHGSNPIASNSCDIQTGYGDSGRLLLPQSSWYRCLGTSFCSISMTIGNQEFSSRKLPKIIIWWQRIIVVGMGDLFMTYKTVKNYLMIPRKEWKAW